MNSSPVILAASVARASFVYKGRVTRVLPGMQSAFVDIGLERDAFLYVSDFLELGDEEDSEDFGEIPAPRGAIDAGKPTEAAAPPAELAAETQAETEFEAEDFAAPDEQQAGSEQNDVASGEDAGSGDDGARRWRGRRRRGGRRGRPEERDERPETKTESVKPPEPVAPRVEQQRPRSDYGPPPGYTPMVLPGESISKYRNRAPAAPPQEENESAPVPAEDFVPAGEPNSQSAAAVQETESAANFEYTNAEPEAASIPEVVETASPAIATEEPQGQPKRHWWRRESSPPEVATVAAPAPLEAEPTEAPAAPAAIETAPQDNESPISEQPGGLDLVPSEPTIYPPLSAPSVAPEGRTLEHEVLEDEVLEENETEFLSVPDDPGALSEVAGDEGLELEEETLDADDGYSERWVPKIAEVDEDEVVAAEMRGETVYDPATEEEEEVEEEASEEPETNGHAEVRAASPTAGYQQRRAARPGYDRNNRDRFRRGGGGPRRNLRARPNNNRNQPLITDLLKEGQEVLIQIAKEPIAKKGARITSHIALPGRFLVYMPTVNHVGVSRKIASDEERQRLKRIVTSERENGLGGFIVRTAAAHIKEDDLRADIRFLKHLWAEIKSRSEESKSPALIYHDLNLVERVLRDQVNADFSQIWVDTEDEFERVVRFANRFQPSLVKRIKLYTKDTPLFEEFGIQDEINRSLKSKVWLKSGGHIVINQTEALVAIDINTGKYVGKTQRLEDTIAKTNVDAVKEIVRQIRLRDLGGIIVIDFIDMDERKNRQKVMQALEEALRNDRAPSKVLQFNDFGLVAITRKRVKQSLERTLGETCSYCAGAGFVKSVPTVCNELYIEMRKMAKVHDKSDITLRVHPEVAKALKASNGKLISEMEELTGKTVLVKSDPLLHQENFDIH